MGTREDLRRLFGAPLMTAEQARGGPPATEIGRIFDAERAHYGVTPEQYLWLSALRRVDPSIGLDHVWDLTPAALAATERSFATNLVILDAYLQYGVSGPKYPYVKRAVPDPTLYDHEQWLDLDAGARGQGDADAAAELLDRFASGDWRASEADLSTLRRAGAGWEAQLLETVMRGPTLVRDPTIGVLERKTMGGTALARAELRGVLAAR